MIEEANCRPVLLNTHPLTRHVGTALHHACSENAQLDDVMQWLLEHYPEAIKKRDNN
jgi:hypothetical protein